jgi:hypothetical protein
MQVHIITGATGDCVGCRGQVIAAQLNTLTGEKPQALTARGFQMEERNIVVDHFDASYPGGNLLVRNLFAALSLRSLEHDISHRAVAAHQNMIAILFLLANYVIVVPDLANFTGNNFCQALAAIAIATTITKREA